MEFGTFSGREIQNIIAFLSHCENHGVTDIRFVRQRASEYLHRNRPRMKMTPEQRKQAREVKKILRTQEVKSALAQQHHSIADCHNCDTGKLREIRRGDAILVACTQVRDGRIVVGCGYSELIAGGEY